MKNNIHTNFGEFLNEFKSINSERFNKWFRKSKVVDKKGEPLVVYHGTTADFDSFKGSVMYFSRKPKYASAFAEDRAADTNYYLKPSVVPVYLSIQNPLDLTLFKNDRVSITEFSNYLKKCGVLVFEDMFRYNKSSELPVWSWIKLNGEFILPYIVNAGYDGIIMHEYANFNGRRLTDVAYIAFYQNQIKSAIGNNGNYSLASSNINEFNSFENNTNFRKWFRDSKVVDKTGEPKLVYHGTNQKFNNFDIKKIGYGSGNYGHYGYGFYFSDDIREAKNYGNTIIKCYLRIENPFTGTDEQLLQLKENGIDTIDDQVIQSIDYESLFDEIKRVDKDASILVSYIKLYGLEKAWDKFFEEKREVKEYYNELSNIVTDYTTLNDNSFEVPEYVFDDLKNIGVELDNLKYNKGFKYDISLHWVTDLGNSSKHVTEVMKKLGFDGVIYGSEYVVFESNQIKSADNNGNFSLTSDNINENDQFLNKLKNDYLYFSDMYSIFVENKLNDCRFIMEIFRDDLIYDKSVGSTEDKIKNSDFYKDLERIWNRYKSNYILSAKEINDAVTKLIDKRNRNVEIETNRKKKEIKSRIKSGTKKFDGLTIDYTLEPIVTSENKKMVDRIGVKYDDDTKLVTVTKYDLKGYTKPDERTPKDKYEEWYNKLAEYMPQMEKWAEENNYYLWSY